MSALSFSKETPNKISNKINVSGRNTLIKTDNCSWRAAIADEPIDTKVDGKKMFCVRVDNAEAMSYMMIGFSSMETFDSTKDAYFGWNGFTGCGILLNDGNLYSQLYKYQIVDSEISKKAKEIIVILKISNKGQKKEIRLFFDGKGSKSSDVSEYLNGDCSFAAICCAEKIQQVTTIPIDQIRIRTPEIERLILEHHYLPQRDELERTILHQHQIIVRGLKERMEFEVFKSLL